MKWAALLARRAPREAWSEAFPLVCPTCRGSLTFIAFLTDPEPVPDFEFDQSREGE